VPVAERSNIVETMEAIMLANPADWKKYYRGSTEQQRLLRAYSYSDRIRYYWRFSEVEASVARLMRNLQQTGMPRRCLANTVRASTMRYAPGD